jgi:glycosyltransferase involved in cell wall biosynthesis
MPQAQVRVLPGQPGTWWEQMSLPGAVARDHLDVFFAPGYTAPLNVTVPTVVLVHDISFVAHPEWFRFREGIRRRLLTRWSSTNAAFVLTVSDATRREILAYFALDPRRVRRIYPGVVSLKTSDRFSSEPLVLFVGSVFNRRHLPDLIRGFAPIARRIPEARLAIVGDNRTYPYEDLPAIAAAAGVSDRVDILPYADDTTLAALYGRARVFVLLSEYEGFGHPPLEALHSGVPSVLLDTDVAREVCGEAALYVRNSDSIGLTSTLESLLFDDAVRARVLQAAPGVLARYAWPRAASETLMVFEEAANG